MLACPSRQRYQEDLPPAARAVHGGAQPGPAHEARAGGGQGVRLGRHGRAAGPGPSGRRQEIGAVRDTRAVRRALDQSRWRRREGAGAGGRSMWASPRTISAPCWPSCCGTSCSGGWARNPPSDPRGIESYLFSLTLALGGERLYINRKPAGSPRLAEPLPPRLLGVHPTASPARRAAKLHSSDSPRHAFARCGEKHKGRTRRRRAAASLSERDQKAKRKPIRNTRWSRPSRPVFATLLMTPKPLLAMLEFGLAKCGVFDTLKISPRN